MDINNACWYDIMTEEMSDQFQTYIILCAPILLSLLRYLVPLDCIRVASSAPETPPLSMLHSP